MKPWIRHRSNGRWYLSVIDDEGAEHPHGGYRTRREALAKYRELTEGGYVAPSGDTVSGFLRMWLETRKAADVAPGTLALDEMNVRTITALVGNVRLHEYGTVQHARMRVELLKTRRPKTVRNIEGTLKKALDDATHWRPKPLLSVNPLAGVKPPRADSVERDAWSEDEVRRFLRTADSDRLHAVWRLALATGARRGELAGLQWSDIDGTKVTFRRQLLLPGPYVRDTTKGRRPRTVRIDEETASALRRWKVQQDKERRWDFGVAYKTDGGWPVRTEAAWVVTEPDGTLVNPATLLARWKALVKVAGVRPIPLHSARHTYITRALHVGIPIDIVSRQAGHRSVATTIDMYSHDDEKTLEEAARQIGTVLGT